MSAISCCKIVESLSGVCIVFFAALGDLFKQVIEANGPRLKPPVLLVIHLHRTE